MSNGLNVIALISGGKDSLFSLLHCVQNGHNVVALANLYPSSQPSMGPNTGQNVTSQHQKQDQSLQGLRLVDHEDADLNSFMYQTVGYSLIPLYATVLQLPLFRQEITGASILQSQDYDSSDHRLSADETEDLVPLLRTVISAHPEANAVSTGAILSTYQRTRVEAVTIRLGLTPLSFLWQYPILPPPSYTPTSSLPSERSRPDSLTGLLEDIALAGVDARIIKIASAGISENTLFANVADSHTQKRLLNGLAPFFEDNDEIGLRGAVLGEGGEYETIALSGPKAIWKGGKITIDESVNDTFTEGGVMYVRFGQARVVPHDEGSNVVESEDEYGNSLVPIPGLLDPQFECIQTNLNENGTRLSGRTLSSQTSTVISTPSSMSHIAPQEAFELFDSHFNISHTLSTNSITISNITSSSISAFLNTHTNKTTPHPTNDTSVSVLSSTNLSPPSTAATQFQTILSHLSELFSHISKTYNLPSLSTKNITSTTLLLNSITEFASINPIYSQLWPTGFPNPPARVTIAVPLPPNIQVSLSLALDLCSSSQRRGLHVQGRSYWAPANIGPYSQAITIPLAGNVHHSDKATDEDQDNEASQKLGIVHIAGQIPLVPCSMEVHTGSFLDTAILSLQHLWRVGQERKVDIWPWAVAYLAQNTEINTNATTAAAVWRGAHLKPTWATAQDDDDEASDEEDTVDIWDLQYNHSLHSGFRSSNMSIGKHRHILPNHSVFNKSNQKQKQKHIPPLLIAEVIALPRNVSIEWWSHGITGLSKPTPTTAQPTWQCRTLPWGTVSCLNITTTTSTSTSTQHKTAVAFISVYISSSFASTSTAVSSIPNTLSEITQTIIDDNNITTETKLAQGTAFITTRSPSSTRIWKHMTSTPESLGTMTTTIPCYSLSGHHVRATSTTDIHDEHDELDELAVAFLLRVEILRNSNETKSQGSE